MVVLRPDEELRELESLSLTIKSMFCEREKVPVLNSNQQNDKYTQEYQGFMYKGHDTCNAYLWQFYLHDIPHHLLQCYFNDPMHTANVFHHEFVYSMIFSLYPL